MTVCERRNESPCATSARGSTSEACNVPRTLTASNGEVCSTAIDYADLGWRVLPLWGIIDGRCACGRPDCPSAGKHPHGRFAPRGMKDGTIDGATICTWYANGDVVNVGIATGPESGLVVLDVDDRHDGSESLRALGDLRRTATVQTGGGRHYYFRLPVDLDIRNSAGKLGPGLDIRAAGGYVVAPPSMHVSGARYKWLVDPRGGLADLPRCILDRLTERPKAAAPVVGDVIPCGERDDTFASLAGSMRRRGMSKAGILAALRVENARCEEPLPDVDLQRISKSIGSKPEGVSESGQGKATVDPAAIASQFVAERYTSESVATLRWWREGYYVYRHGIYRELPVAELKAEIAEYLRTTGTKLSTHTMAAVLLSINGILMVRHHVQPGTWMDDIDGPEGIVATNGNVTFANERPKLLPHSPSFFSLTRLDYPYDPEATCPMWKAFVAQVMSGDSEYVTLLQQWCGYLFRRDLREHKFVVLVGEGSNGKGVFCDVVESLVGPENVSHIPLGLFSRPFSLYGTLGKVVNVTSESHHLVEDAAETQLKAFVAGDAMSFERKFRDPVNAVPTAKVMIATNHLPRFNDKTFGLWRRVLMVPFNETFRGNRQNKGLAAELKTELPGILNWAIEGLESLSRNGGFSIPARHEEHVEEYRRDADPTRAFLLDNYEPTTIEAGVPCGELYEAYRQWCDLNGCRPMNERTFGQQVRRVFPNVERVRPGSGTGRTWVYRGILAVTSYASQAFPI